MVRQDHRIIAAAIVALEDACPRRKMPLSRGRRSGDALECGYHGLTFNCAGQCIVTAGQGLIPSNAKVRTYPCEERYGLVWIWMGSSALAEPAGIFDIPHFDNPAWAWTRAQP